MNKLSHYFSLSLLVLGVIFPLTARASSTYKETWIATGFIGVSFVANTLLSETMCTGPNEWYVEGTNPANQEWYRELWQATDYVATGNALEETFPNFHHIDQVNQVYGEGSMKYPNFATVNLDGLKLEVIQAQANGQLRALCNNANGYIHPDPGRSAVMRPAGEYGAWITTNLDVGQDEGDRWGSSLGVVTFPTKWEIRGKVITP